MEEKLDELLDIVHEHEGIFQFRYYGNSGLYTTMISIKTLGVKAKQSHANPIKSMDIVIKRIKDQLKDIQLPN